MKHQYHIKPKRDFDKYGFLINGKWVRSGFVVTDGLCNVMPGATWFGTLRQALVGIDCLERSQDYHEFWKLIRADIEASEENSLTNFSSI